MSKVDWIEELKTVRDAIEGDVPGSFEEHRLQEETVCTLNGLIRMLGGKPDRRMRLTVHDASRSLGVSEAAIGRAIRLGALPAVKGRLFGDPILKWLIPGDALWAYRQKTELPRA